MHRDGLGIRYCEETKKSRGAFLVAAAGARRPEVLKRVCDVNQR